VSEKSDLITYFGETGTDTLYTPGLRTVVELQEEKARMVEAPASETSTVRAASVIGFENVIGSSAPDHFIGDGGDNYLHGGGGDDYLNGARGNDVLIGGAGTDTLANTDVSSGVYIDLQKERAYIPVLNELDIIREFENVDASNFDDVVLGSTGSNQFHGYDGNDMLFGRDGDDALLAEGGDDILSGGQGNDTLNGGEGSDKMEGGPGDDVYTVNQMEDEVVELVDEGSDTVRIATTSYVLPRQRRKSRTPRGCLAARYWQQPG
jgi:Ca2+-binding RTX toxin-like protein